MKSDILELFAYPTELIDKYDWKDVINGQKCLYLGKKCLKNRKSEPEVAIGSCTIRYGKEDKFVIICPHRLLEKRRIFTDCLHLLTLHEPGNDLHVVSELSIPGGSVDYFLVSAKKKKVQDFVGIELQSIDTTGSVWEERERLFQILRKDASAKEEGTGGYGINWKMTAKTTLLQLHHKIETFEHINKHLVLVMQDHLLNYMDREFSFDHVTSARIGDPMHFHAYSLLQEEDGYHIQLAKRISTDMAGISKCLGLKTEAKLELEEIIGIIEAKLSDETLIKL